VNLHLNTHVLVRVFCVSYTNAGPKNYSVLCLLRKTIS